MFSSCWAINSIEKVVGGQKSWEPSKGWLRLRKGQILQTTESWVWVNTGAQHSCYQEWAAHGRVPLVILTTSTAGTALCSATTFLTWQRLLRQMFYPEFQLSNSPSRVNKILLAAFLHPGSVHEISWLDHFTAALGVLQLITQIFTFSEGKTKCIRLKSENLFFSSPFLWGFDWLKQMSVKTTWCAAQQVIKRSEEQRSAAVLQHPDSSRARGNGATANAIRRTSPDPTAKSNLQWSFGKQPPAHLLKSKWGLDMYHWRWGDTFWSSEMYLTVLVEQQRFWKFPKSLSTSGFLFKATYGLKTRSRLFHHPWDSENECSEFWEWGTFELGTFTLLNKGSKKAGAIKETWDYSRPEKSHITDCLRKIVTLLFSRCNHTSHKCGSQNDTTQKVSVWPDSKGFI